MILAPLVLTAALAADPAAGARLEATLSPTEITVGDRVAARVVLSLPGEGGSADRPILEVGDRWGEARVLEVSPIPDSPRDGEERHSRRWAWDLEITAFRPGRLDLPPLTATVPGDPPIEVTMTQPTALTVTSVLPSDGEAELRPPTPPAEWPGISRWWWAAAALMALLPIAFLVWSRRRRSDAGGLAGRTRRSPLETLGNEVDELVRIEDSEVIHTRLSRAARAYLEARMGFPAVEHTTTEIRRDLETSAVPAEIGRGFLEILRRCDDVKFARRTVDPGTGRHRAHRALALARSLEEALRASEPAEEVA